MDGPEEKALAVAPPTKPARRRRAAGLLNFASAAREMAQVYRALKRDEIDPRKANAMAYVLSQLCELLVVADAHQRIARIEEAIAKTRDIAGTVKR